MKRRFSLGEYLFVMVIACLLLALVGLFCSGAIYADDGSNGGSDIQNWQVVLGGIGIALWTIYWPSLLAAWRGTWADKKLGFWKKVGYSIADIAGSLLPCLEVIWKSYGGVIIKLVVGLIKVRLGIPAAVKAVKARK